MKNQELVRALMVLYRWGALLAAGLAIAGLVVGVATRAGRRHVAVAPHPGRLPHGGARSARGRRTGRRHRVPRRR